MSERAPILLVDDQELVAETLRGLLQGADDLELHYCGQPAQAIATATACRPDVILLDLVMPGVDGLMLLRFLRGHPDFGRTPILLLSTRDEPESKARAFELGANDYLIKLPHRTEMLARLRYHVAAFRLQRERDEAYRELKASRELLASTNQELERANQAKSRFIARMSHELRTPLNGILGLCQVLEQSGLPSLQNEYVGIIRGAGDLLLSVINDILDYSKIESGKVELESIPFSLEEAAEQVLRLLAARAHEKGLTLVANLDPTLPALVLGDPLRLRQVLWNLVGNAVKFTEQGEVEVRMERVSASGDVDLSVRDTGIGIPPEAQGQLFQAFSQADAGTARRFGGTGLGLVIAQNLCHLMGGDLKLESRVGEGTTFSARLAFSVVEEAEAPSFPELKLLLHEPNEAARQALVRVLTAWGVELTDDCNAVLYHAGGDELPPAVVAAQDRLLPTVALVPLGTHGGSYPGPILPKPIRRAELRERLATVLEPPDDLWEEAPAPVPAAAPAARNAHGPQLLVADDNPTNLLVARAMLEQMGYRVLEARDGLSAVELAQRDQVAAVLLDCDMPVMDGFEAARRIRAARGEELPILALTAYSGEEIRRQCQAAGMNDFAGKPLDREVLGSLLRRWIKPSQPPGAAGSSPAAG